MALGAVYLDDEADGIAGAPTVRIADEDGSYSIYMHSEPVPAAGDLRCAIGGYNGWKILPEGEGRVSAGADVGVDPTHSITIAVGKNRTAKEWTNKPDDWGTLTTELAKHKPRPKKDSRGFVAGKLLGGSRKAEAMYQMDLMILDMDGGQPLDVVKERIAAAGLECFIYTTWSHLSTTTNIKQDNYKKWLRDNPAGDHAGYLIDKKGYLRETVDGILSVEEKHSQEGLIYKITHGAIEKYRLVFPLSHPVIFEELEGSHKDRLAFWSRLYSRFAESLGLWYDHSCTDASRLFYFPSYKEGTDPRLHKTYHVRGKALNWLLIDLTDAEDPYIRAGNAEAKGSGGSFFYGDLNLKRWKATVKSFEIANAVRENDPDVLHNDDRTIVCPFEDGHSEPGGTGAYVENGCDTDTGEGFKVSCRHNHCAGYDKLDFVRAMLEQGWLTRDQLEDESLGFVEFKEGYEPKATGAEIATLASDIAAANKATTLAPFYPRLAAVEDAGERSRHITALAKATGAGATAIKREVTKAGKPAKAKDIGERTTDGRWIVSADAGPAEQIATGVKGIVARNDPPTLFHDGAGMVRLDGREHGKRQLRPLDHGMQRAAFYENVAIVQTNENGAARETNAARDVIPAVFGSSELQFPPVERLARAPFFDASGSLVIEPGYHPDSRVILDPSVDVPAVPAVPTYEDVRQARGCLDEWLHDFPFEGPHHGAAERAHMLAMTIQPFMRLMIAGPTPAYFIDKPAAGVGASLLVETASLIADGRPAGMVPLPKAEEMEKKIFATLRSGSNFFAIDNVNGKVASEALASALTSDTFKGRILGKSDEQDIQIRHTWVFTGINADFSAEMVRRLVRVRINAPCERPEERTDFLHSPLKPWVAENRAQLVWSVLVLVQNWIAQGQAPWTKRTMGSYEAWARAIGGVLHAARIPGFLANMKDLKKAKSEDTDADKALVVDWWETFDKASVRTTGALDECLFGLVSNAYGGERTTLPIFDRDGNVCSQKFGMHLKKKIEGRTFDMPDGTAVKVRADGKTGNVAKYRLCVENRSA